jgi:hypothetical protein
MTVDDFVCEPEPSCGLVRYEAAERAFFQLQDTGSIRMRVTATAPGRDGVLATVNTCAPSVFFCDDRSTDYVPVEVRP